MELKSALIVGVGLGLSASLARLFPPRNGIPVALASRNPDQPRDAGARETAAATFACEAAMNPRKSAACSTR